LELQPSESVEQTYVNRMLIDIANNFHHRYIISTDSHYLKKEDAAIHAAYLNAQDGDREVSSFYATTYMMNTEELESHMDLTEAELEEAYMNIRYIASMCEDFSLQKELKIPALQWNEPKTKYVEDKWCELMPTMMKFKQSDYYGDVVLARAIIDRLIAEPSLQTKEVYAAIEDNLDKTWESSLVNKTHWSAYFLNLQRIIDVCWEAGTLVGCGRGSGVGFILLYILGITQINPLAETVQTYSFRFLNPSRVSVLDIDTDIEGGRRADVLNTFRKVYGQDRVANVATFRTEKSKSAVLTAARGLGIDVDVAQYIASLIPADRGQLRTLDQCMYGDEENGFEPIKQFIYEMTENYPELWEVAHKIEGLVCGTGIHAGGVIFVDEPFVNSTALMRAPDGTICTQFDLHDCEDCSLIKMDLLSVEAMDKMHICLDLLCDYGYVERKNTLRETYENTIGIYNLERESEKMWHMVWNHEIQSLFQMEKQSGIQGIALTKPESVDDLAHLNSIIRLMAQEKGGEMPLNKYARFKDNIQLWYDEMYSFGLKESEMKILEPIIKGSYGICESQEAFMQLVQIPECGGFDLNFADKLRKAIAKKNPKAYDELTKEYFETCKEKGLSMNLCNYVWNVLVATSRGYGFNLSHTLAYSLIALQEMNLAYRFPTMFWNCACLISDAGGAESEESEAEESSETQEIFYEDYEGFEDFVEEDEEEEDEDEEEEASKANKKKKKTKSTNYGKIASAIGKIKSSGVNVAPPDINKSTYTFSPDVENNTIRYGLSGITKVGEELVKTIMDGRPYASVSDFLGRIKINKPQMVNLIKSGAFDCFGDRVQIMHGYIDDISDAKKRITLQNMKMLIDFGLIPDEYDLERRVYNFNKYIKKLKLDGTYFGLDEIAFNFYSAHFDIDKLEPCEDTESGFKIKQTTWDNYYQKHMSIVRPFVQKHAAELLVAVNTKLTQDTWNKYCLGSLSKWEMDSVSFYSHEHELADLDMERYELTDFSDLSEDPIVDRVIPIKGKQVPILKLFRICGTVLDRDKSKKTVTLLTISGVVTVKIYGGVFAQYDKQISERGADGKKHVIEKSMFSRGNKIIVIGVRDGDSFRAKKYSRTPYHLVEQIVEVRNDGTMITRSRGEQD
jgi:DNA polymerase-3 subunit alpha